MSIQSQTLGVLIINMRNFSKVEKDLTRDIIYNFPFAKSTLDTGVIDPE